MHRINAFIDRYKDLDECLKIAFWDFLINKAVLMDTDWAIQTVIYIEMLEVAIACKVENTGHPPFQIR